MGWDNSFLTILVLPSGATTGARIVLDGTRNAIFIYDLSNNLIASIAAQAGFDDFGNAYLAGQTSYNEDVISGHTYFSNLTAGSLEFGAVDLPTVTPGGVTWSELSAGYSLFLDSGKGPGENSSNIEMFSETGPGTNDAGIAVVGDQHLFIGDVEFSGAITAANIDFGKESVTTVAGSWVENAPVAFNKTFRAAPTVTLTGNTNAPATGGATALYYAATNITTSSFTLRVFRSTAITMDIGWMALGPT